MDPPPLRPTRLETAPPPGPVAAQDMWESGAYYQMKLMKEFKGKDENQMKLATTMKAVFVALQAARPQPCSPSPRPDPDPDPGPDPDPDP